MTHRKRIGRAALLGLLAAFGLTACALERPPSNSCPALPLGGLETTVSTQQADPDTVNAMIRAIGGGAAPARPPVTVEQTRAAEEAAMGMATSMVEQAMRAEAQRTPAAEPITVRVLTMSAGGQWGAYGAGLMTGWSQNPSRPRPAFDVVTGVSAGAILGVPVFAGSQFDPVLRYFREISDEDVSQRRSLPALLRSPSLNDPAALEAYFRQSLTPELIASIADRHAEGDQLLISATDLHTTATQIFDIGSAAGMEDKDKAADCIIEAMLASAAIPGLFPPRHINGVLYADGGLRDQVFFRAVDTARATVARDLGRPVRVEAYLVVNGALMPTTRPPEDKLISYLSRSLVALADEVQRDSVTDAVNFAAGRPGWTLWGMVPDVDLTACEFGEVPVGTFDACLTKVVFDQGVEDGQAVPIDWLNAEELREVASEL
ncbi:MAG: patatin-like phospholipase family protein [Pseudomonadota bacterium]